MMECYQHKVYTNRTGRKTLEAAFRCRKDATAFLRSIAFYENSEPFAAWIGSKKFKWDGTCWST